MFVNDISQYIFVDRAELKKSKTSLICFTKATPSNYLWHWFSMVSTNSSVKVSNKNNSKFFRNIMNLLLQYVVEVFDFIIIIAWVWNVLYCIIVTNPVFILKVTLIILSDVSVYEIIHYESSLSITIATPYLLISSFLAEWMMA